MTKKQDIELDDDQAMFRIIVIFLMLITAINSATAIYPGETIIIKDINDILNLTQNDTLLNNSYYTLTIIGNDYHIKLSADIPPEQISILIQELQRRSSGGGRSTRLVYNGSDLFINYTDCIACKNDYSNSNSINLDNSSNLSVFYLNDTTPKSIYETITLYEFILLLLILLFIIFLGIIVKILFFTKK